MVVDAALGGETVQMRAVCAEPVQERGSGGARKPGHAPLAGEDTSNSHELTPAVLLSLTRRLHGRAPELVLCTLPGARFDFGTTISPSVQALVDPAVCRITGWVRGANLAETG